MGEPRSGNPGEGKIVKCCPDKNMQVNDFVQIIMYPVIVLNPQTSELAGYQVGRPVIAGIVDTLENNTGSIERTSLHLWEPGNSDFCLIYG